MSGMFQKAAKRQSFLRLALEGPAGYGKTYTALEIATRLAPGKVAFVDTEAGSATKYADLFDFDVVEMDPPFHPNRAVEAIANATESGYGAVIVDSLSHFWTGEGGLLELIDEIARTKYRGDSHRAWQDGGQIQQALVDAILRSKLHVVAAMRTKKDYVRETYTDDKGRERTKIRAAGTKTIQRDEFDYEFDIIGRFDVPMVMAIVKSRCAALPPETMIEKPGEAFAEGIAAWLSSGESFAEQEKAEAEAAKKAEKERKAAEKAAAAEITALEERLELLVAEYRELVPDFKTNVAELVSRHRADDDFVSWLGKQVERFQENVDTKRAEVPESEPVALPEDERCGECGELGGSHLPDCSNEIPF